MSPEVQSEVKIYSYSFSMSALFWNECTTSRTGRFAPANETRYPVLQKAGWAPSSVWTGVEKRKPLTHTGVLTPERPFRSKSLSRKQESFCPLGYTHRPKTLGVVSRL